MDDDFGRLVRTLHFQQPLDHLVFFSAAPAGINLNDLRLVPPVEKRIRLNERHQLARVRRLAGDDEHERLHGRLTCLARVGVQLNLDALVQADAIFQLQLLDSLSRHARRVEILACDDRRFLDEAVGHRAAQGIVEDDVVESDRTLWCFHLRGRCQLKPHDRSQFVDRLDPGRRAVSVRLIHDQDEVVEPGEVRKVALADVLRQPFDSRRFAATDLGVDLGDIEDVDLASIRLIEQ